MPSLNDKQLFKTAHLKTNKLVNTKTINPPASQYKIGGDFI